MISALTSFFVVVACGYMFKLIFSQSQKIPDEIAGKLLLKPVKIFSYLGISSILFGVALWGLLFIEVNQKMSTVKGIAIVSFLFILAGLYLYLGTKRYFVEISDDKIICQSWTGKRREILWSDIIATDFKNIASMELVLKTKNDKVAIYMFIEGFNLVLDKVKSKLSPEVYEKAFTKLEKLKERRSDIFNI
jgi:hypothetical protein